MHKQAVVGVILALASFSAFAEEQVPLTATVSFSSVVTPRGPGEVQVAMSGTGNASHLGKITYNSTEIADFFTNPGKITVHDGHFVIVAANGDEVHGEAGTLGDLPDASGNTQFVGVFRIVGGTGRFANASGGGTIRVIANLYAGIGTILLDGAITSVGSSN